MSFLTSAKPYWEEEPKDVETSVGASTTFICKAKGYPEPKIAWFVNGIKLEGKVNWFSVICDADHLVVSAPFCGCLVNAISIKNERTNNCMMAEFKNFNRKTTLCIGVDIGLLR